MVRRVFAVVALLAAIGVAVGGLTANYSLLAEHGHETLGKQNRFMHGLMFGGEPMSTMILAVVVSVLSITASSLRNGLEMIRPVAGFLPIVFLVALGLCGVFAIR